MDDIKIETLDAIKPNFTLSSKIYLVESIKEF